MNHIMHLCFITYFVCANFAWAQPPDCEALLAEISAPGPDFSKIPSVVERDIRPLWSPDKFTDPQVPVSSRYKFIVRVGDFEDVKTNVISASLISNELNRLYAGASWAYILGVAAENVVAGLPQDSGRLALSSNAGAYTDEDLNRAIARYGLRGPERLIKDSILSARLFRDPNHYNEIFVRTDRIIDGSRTKIIGIVHFPSRDPVNSDARNLARFNADRFKVPLVELP